MNSIAVAQDTDLDLGFSGVLLDAKGLVVVMIEECRREWPAATN